MSWADNSLIENPAVGNRADIMTETETVPSAKDYRRNLKLINALSFFSMFLIIIPVFVPLMQQYGLTMQQLMLTQSVFAACIIVLEIPSGMLADWFGRKSTLMFGTLLSGISFTTLLWADSFIDICVFEGLTGVAYSLLSGSDTSLAFESEKALTANRQSSSIARLLSWTNLGESAASFSAFVLVGFGLYWVIIAQVVIAWAPFLISIGIIEPPRTINKSEPRMPIKRLFNQHRYLGGLMLIYLAVSCASYLVAWLNPMLWQQQALPVAYFGLLWAAISLTIAAANRASARIINHLGKRLFLCLPLLLLLSYLALTAQNLIWIISGAFTIALFRGLTMPSIKMRLNQQIGNQHRATINSVMQAMFRFGSLLLGPVMGLIVDRYGARVGAFSLAFIFMPATLGLWLLGRRSTIPAPAGKNAS